MNNRVHVVVDIETLSTQSNAGIISIGAAAVSTEIEENKVVIAGIDHFYDRIKLESVEAAGLDIDSNTIKWWMEQNEEVRKEAFGGTDTGREVLLAFNEYLNSLDNFSIWGYGADFDCVVIKNNMDAYDIRPEFKYKQHRCLRTLAKLLTKYF